MFYEIVKRQYRTIHPQFETNNYEVLCAKNPQLAKICEEKEGKLNYYIENFGGSLSNYLEEKRSFTLLESLNIIYNLSLLFKQCQALKHYCLHPNKILIYSNIIKTEFYIRLETSKLKEMESYKESDIYAYFPFEYLYIKKKMSEWENDDKRTMNEKEADDFYFGSNKEFKEILEKSQIFFLGSLFYQLCTKEKLSLNKPKSEKELVKQINQITDSLEKNSNIKKNIISLISNMLNLKIKLSEVFPQILNTYTKMFKFTISFSKKDSNSGNEIIFDYCKLIHEFTSKLYKQNKEIKMKNGNYILINLLLGSICVYLRKLLKTTICYNNPDLGDINAELFNYCLNIANQNEKYEAYYDYYFALVTYFSEKDEKIFKNFKLKNFNKEFDINYREFFNILDNKENIEEEINEENKKYIDFFRKMVDFTVHLFEYEENEKPMKKETNLVVLTKLRELFLEKFDKKL